MAAVIVIPAVIACLVVLAAWYVALPIMVNLGITNSYWATAPDSDRKAATQAVNNLSILPFGLIGAIIITAILKSGQQDVNES